MRANNTTNNPRKRLKLFGNTHMRIKPFVCFAVVLPVNKIGDEGTTAIAGALVEITNLVNFSFWGECVIWWYACIIGSDMKFH